jgi:ribosomal protein S15P/S13E
MAALQELARALRENFKSETSTIQLIEILQFIDNYSKTSTQSSGEEGVEKPPQNAKITRKNASTTTRQTPSKTAQEAKQHSTQASTRPTEQRKETSYADIARKALKNSPTPIALPKSLQNTPKPPTTIKITLRNPLKETPKDLIDKIRT